jgi:hypothetical protein
MDVIATKVVVLILLGFIKLGSGLLPVLLSKVLQVRKVRAPKISTFYNFKFRDLISISD